MSFKSGVSLLGKYILLTGLYFIITLISSGLLSFNLPAPPADQAAALLPGLVVVAAVNVLVISLIILRSRWSGWRLALATGFSWFGVMSVMSVIEALYFGPLLGITANMAPGLVLPNLVAVAIFTPLAVLILGKGKATDAGELVTKVSMPAGQWAVKLAAISVIYLALYWGFGVFIAWRNPELRAMYGNGLDQAIFAPIRLFSLQILRSWLWVLFTLPVIRMTKGSSWQVAIIVGLLVALPMNIGLILPSAFMPDPGVRLSHLIETTTSNFILGLAITWLFYRRHSSVRDLFGRGKTSEEEAQPVLTT